MIVVADDIIGELARLRAQAHRAFQNAGSVRPMSRFESDIWHFGNHEVRCRVIMRMSRAGSVPFTEWVCDRRRIGENALVGKLKRV